MTILDVKGFPLSWQWYIGHTKGKRLSVVTEAFLDFIKREGDRIIRV